MYHDFPDSPVHDAGIRKLCGSCRLGEHPVSLPLLLATAFCSFILLCEDLHSFVCLRIAYHGKQEAEMVTLLVQGLVEPVFSAERCYHSHWRLTGNHKGEEWRGSTEQ